MPVSMHQRFQELKDATLEQWRTWAESIADGGAAPTPVAVLDAGAVLEVSTPMIALQADADAINEARGLELRIEQSQARDAARLEPYGGFHGAKQRLLAIDDEARKLRGLLQGHGFDAGHAKGELVRLKEKHPRVFAEPAKKTATKEKSKR